ncbi:MAG: DUF2125 domain-containing protein [Caulobacteraceae bacterium]|nr:DUF2125 domain-containing protein [Caulobacteraceae bacterium]
MPDLDSPRKPPRRFWLYAPYAALAIGVVGWSIAWQAISWRLASQMDQTAQRLRAAGWTVDWRDRAINGYPFRLDLTLIGARLAEPSGWGLAADKLKGETYAYAPDHWVLVAPAGVTLTRPGKGAVAMTGSALRASLGFSGPLQAPRIAVEGVRMTYVPAPRAAPLPIAASDRLGLYVRPLAGDQAEAQLRLDGARPQTGALLERLFPGRPVNLVWDVTLSKASLLNGRDWPAAARAWSAAGGTAGVVHGEVSGGGSALSANGGALTLDAQGRLAGSVPLDLTRLSGASLPNPGGKVTLTLKDGQMTIGPAKIGGPVRIGAAARAY